MSVAMRQSVSSRFALLASDWVLVTVQLGVSGFQQIVWGLTLASPAWVVAVAVASYTHKEV